MINIFQLWKNDPEIELNAEEINNLIEAYKRKEELPLEKLNTVKKVLLLASNGESLKIESVETIEQKRHKVKLLRTPKGRKKSEYTYHTTDFFVFIKSPAIIDKDLKVAVPIYSFDCGGKELEKFASII